MSHPGGSHTVLQMDVKDNQKFGGKETRPNSSRFGKVLGPRHGMFTAADWRMGFLSAQDVHGVSWVELPVKMTVEHTRYRQLPS